MYGTIMRAQVKPGQREAFIETMKKRATGGANPGFVSAELAFEDKDPDRVIGVIHFRDRESYLANAERPETDASYQEMVAQLAAPPEWIDVHYVAYRGEPLSEQATAGATG
jgi:quinol monooxygenase YgiN